QHVRDTILAHLVCPTRRSSDLALVHGSSILQVDGTFDDCLDLARGLAEKYPVALVNSVNPDRIEGQKTAAFEVVDMLGDAPDVQDRNSTRLNSSHVKISYAVLC